MRLRVSTFGSSHQPSASLRVAESYATQPVASGGGDVIILVVSKEGRGTCMAGGIVCFAVGPCTPEYADPCACEDADSVRMIASARAGALVDIGRPWALVSGVVGEACDGNGIAVGRIDC